MKIKCVIVLGILVISSLIVGGCLKDDEKDKTGIIIINRPFLNATAFEIHLEPGEEWEFEFWWETEGRQEWPDSTDLEFIFNNSKRVGKVEGYGQIDNISTDEWEPSLKYTAFDDMVGFEKIQYRIIIYYEDRYFNQSGQIVVYVEKEFKDIEIEFHDRYYRTIEDIIGTADDDSSTYKAEGFFTWPDMEGAEIYEMTIHFNGNDPGPMFWNNDRPYVYQDGVMAKKYANSNHMPEGELKGWSVGLDDHKDDYLVMMGGARLEFEDGQWEQTDIDTAIAENKTKTQDYFEGWTCDVKVVP